MEKLYSQLIFFFTEKNNLLKNVLFIWKRNKRFQVRKSKSHIENVIDGNKTNRQANTNKLNPFPMANFETDGLIRH